MSQARRIARMDEQLRRLQSRDWRPAKFRTAGKPLTRPGESGHQSWDDVMSPLRPRMLGHLAELERMKSGNLDVHDVHGSCPAWSFWQLLWVFLPSAQVAQNTSKVRPAPSPIAVSKMGSLQDAANTQPLWTTRMERNLFGQFPPVMWLAFTERSRSGIISMFPYVSRFLFSEDLGRFENPVGSDFSLVLRCFKPPNPTTMGVSENGYWHDLTWLAGRKFNEKPIRLYVLQCSS
jgi:hypothetical protein